MKTSNRFLLFLDESGKSNLSDAGKYFLLSGLIISRELHTALSAYMISLKEKSSISSEENLHAFDLFEAERVKEGRIPHNKVDGLFNRLTFLIEGTEIRSFIFRIDKTPYIRLINKTAIKQRSTDRAVIRFLRRNNIHDFLYEALTRKAILEFGRFLEKVDAGGEVVAESRRQDDEAVLRAFIAATKESTYEMNSRCRPWAAVSFKRIHGLTFQNKKGLSFGLEVADLFGWAYLNNQYGRKYPIVSVAHNKRVEKRLRRMAQITRPTYYKNGPELITPFKVKSVAKDRVSEFTELLKQYEGSRLFGDTTR